MKSNKNKSGERTPLMRKMIIPLLAVTILQAVIFYFSMAVSDTADELNATSESLLAESSEKRALYVETEMTKKWSSISPITRAADKAYTAIASKYALSVKEFLDSDKYTSDFLSDISDDVLAALRINSTDGAFFVLANSTDAPDNKQQSSYRGILFNDSDPNFTPDDYSDMVMVRGSSKIAEEYSVSLDVNWTDKFRYAPDRNRMDYFFAPAAAAYENPHTPSDELGYWSRPFYLTENKSFHSNMIIAYSEPVIIDNVVIGTAGITVYVDRISSLLPSNEAGSENGCYALLSYSEGNSYITIDDVSETNNGFDQYTEKPLKFVSSKDSKLKKISDVKINGSQAYCAYTDLNLYSEDSPYAREKWALGVVDSADEIYTNSSFFRMRLIVALIISIAVGTATVYVTAKYSTKPINELVKKIKTVGTNDVIDIISTDISEIHALSETLNELSSKRTKYQNELITERERYLLALKNINENILEYDCATDIFYMHYFRGEDKNGNITTNQYPNFRKRVTDGEICHRDYIGTMLDFTNGLAKESGTYFKIKAPGTEEKYIWTFARSRNVYDNEGNLIRIIASARDVTAEKKLEQRRLDAERRDPVTKFYTSEYGEILLSRFIMEHNADSAISAIVRIVGLDNMLNRYGQTFCSAVLEEIADVIRRNTPENYVVYRGGMDEFVMITTLTSRDEARTFFRKLIDEIAGIYNNENLKLESVVGAYLRLQDEPMSASKLKTRFASAAAYKFRDEFGGIVFADEVTNKADFVQDFRNVGPHRFMPFGNVKLEEVTDIISFAFNIFEKTDDIRIALEVFMKKAGRMLGMDRIIIFNMNSEYYTVRPTVQWNAPDMAALEVKNYFSGKAAYTEFESKINGIEYKITDKVIFERNTVGEGKISSDGTAYSVPMTDNDRITGVMVYQLHEKNDDEGIIACLCELTKIVSAYISKSKTTRESRAKSEFLSKMSHEIRTPMNAIIGMTAIAMSSDNVAPATMECLKKIDSSSHYLLSLINDILDMSRIESGKMTTEETYLNLEELINQIDTMIRVQTDNKGIWLRVENKIEHPHLLGDPLKLNQILVNIMGNAVKFTGSGGIHLKVTESVDENENTVNVSFSVKDTGIGISEENLGKIFNNFEQADTDTVRKYGGTGLGLAISSNLVQLLGGKLEVRSAVGIGSEFFFTIPMKITEAPEDNGCNCSDNVDFTTKRILIVEDDELNSEIARTLIEAEGITAELAENGQEAVEKFCASEENYYDAILMDIRMPVMDGIEATKRIRNTDRLDAFTVPIIAMTANAFDEDMKKSVECGMNGHLTKPIDMTKVMQTFGRIWSVK